MFHLMEKKTKQKVQVSVIITVAESDPLKRSQHATQCDVASHSLHSWHSYYPRSALESKNNSRILYCIYIYSIYIYIYIYQHSSVM